MGVARVFRRDDSTDDRWAGGDYLQQFDVPQELCEHQCSILVVGLVGNPAMNFFGVGVVDRDERTM